MNRHRIARLARELVCTAADSITGQALATAVAGLTAAEVLNLTRPLGVALLALSTGAHP